MKALILVGGEGTRLRPLTCTTPKPMLPLVNIPFIEYIIRLLKEHDICDIILSAGYISDVFESCFNDGGHLGVKLTYVAEDKPLGTCGAVKNVESLLGEETFIVFNGDILTSLNVGQLLEYHRAKKAVATITLTPVEDPTIYGLVPLDNSGRVLEFLEKPSWDEVTTDLINAGTYVIEPEVLKYVPEGENYSFERGLFPALLENQERVFGFPSSAYWLDIGAPEKYLLAHKDILEGKVSLEFIGREIMSADKQVKPRVWVGKRAKISPEATIFGPTVIGENAVIESHATIFSHTTMGNNCRISSGTILEGCVLLDGCCIGEGSVVKNSILGRGLKLGKRVHVEEMVVLGDNMKVGDENHLKRGMKVWPDTEIEQGKIRF